MSIAEIFRPSRSSMIHRSVWSREIDLVASIGFASSNCGACPLSIRSSTSAVVPIFSAVAHWLMFASPMMTWKRRYRCESACGSSRVLTSGRRFIVSIEQSTLKKSERCAI